MIYYTVETMNLRIAILFSGRINTNPHLYESFKTQLCQSYGQSYGYECDVFISHPKNVPAELIREVTELYQPKIIIENNEDYFNVDKYEHHPDTNKHNAMCMYLSRANLWREFDNYVDTTGSSYDAGKRIKTIPPPAFGEDVPPATPPPPYEPLPLPKPLLP